MVRSDDTPDTFQEPHCRRTIVTGLRAAALDLWGQPGVSLLASKLPEETRRMTVDAVGIGGIWLPERYVVDWYHAAYDGPAKQNEAEVLRFIDRMLDFGFGRVRKALLGLVTAPQLLNKAKDLWRHDHTHGLFHIAVRPDRADITLREHPYTQDPLSQACVAEVYRYCVSLSRTKHVRHVYFVDNSTLHVELTWGHAPN